MLISKSLLSCCLALVAVGGAINGTSGDDSLEGTAGNDVINGKAGNDSLFGDAGDDILNGGPGTDILLGWDGDDALHGGPGADELRGGFGDDKLVGGAGDDLLVIVDTQDLHFFPGICSGGVGFDSANGGGGDDTIQWASGYAYTTLFPLPLCVRGGESVADGGGGHDTLVIGTVGFLADSSGYVIEPATRPGYALRVRSLSTGASVSIRNIEVIVFSDDIIELD